MTSHSYHNIFVQSARSNVPWSVWLCSFVPHLRPCSAPKCREASESAIRHVALVAPKTPSFHREQALGPSAPSLHAQKVHWAAPVQRVDSPSASPMSWRSPLCPYSISRPMISYLGRAFASVWIYIPGIAMLSARWIWDFVMFRVSANASPSDYDEEIVYISSSILAQEIEICISFVLLANKIPNLLQDYPLLNLNPTLPKSYHKHCRRQVPQV